ncbi:MAG: ferrous iron transport protein B [Nitrospinae bacterium]|nr:ferrous iron transport protein B [Nitrospinota bacterium]
MDIRDDKKRDHNRDRGGEESIPPIVLIGNPNVGKSVIFGLLTGRYVDVSNYPGTTVEVSRGKIALSGKIDDYKMKEISIIDTPGVNSLLPKSEDERVTRDILIRERPHGIIQVIDAKNLKRGLLITLQLADMGIPFVVVLNIYDEATERGIDIDINKLSMLLGVKVIPMVAIERMGLSDLKKAISDLGHLQRETKRLTKFDKGIEDAIDRLAPLLPRLNISNRGLILMLLSGDNDLLRYLEGYSNDFKIDKVKEIISKTQDSFREPVTYVIQKGRQGVAEEIFNECVHYEVVPKISSGRKRLGDLCMHPFWGIPILISVLYIMYKFVGGLGAGKVVDFMESVVFGEYINPITIKIIESIIPIKIIQEALTGKYGLITVGITYSVSIVGPIVGFFFIFFGVLEDSGYLPRLTILSNKIFKRIGLNGRAVLPMILGLGCDTMATFATRILDTRKERIITTLLLALCIPCSAQLGVVLGMIGGLSGRVLLIVIITVLLQLIIVGYLASKIIPGRSSYFIIEIPPMRIPKLSNILKKTYFRVKWFMKEAVPLFIIGTFILFLLDKLDLLVKIEYLLSPVVTDVLGLPAQATEAFILGFLRRDYGAAGLFLLAEKGKLDLIQITVSTSVMILFVPCIANFFVIIKEQGIKRGILITSFIMFYAIIVGGVLNIILRYIHIL